jgi:hypothetical protein
MNISNTSPNRPDGVLMIAGYYLLLGLGFVFGGIVLLTAAVPSALQMASRDSIFLTGVLVLVILAGSSLALGSWTIQCARGLWNGLPGARRGAVVLSSLMVMMSLLSLPPLWFSYGSPDEDLIMLLLLALGLASTSGLSLWYLTRPAVRRAFGA